VNNPVVKNPVAKSATSSVNNPPVVKSATSSVNNTPVAIRTTVSVKTLSAVTVKFVSEMMRTTANKIAVANLGFKPH
jgi:hypothetical protein